MQRRCAGRLRKHCRAVLEAVWWGCSPLAACLHSCWLVASSRTTPSQRHPWYKESSLTVIWVLYAEYLSSMPHTAGRCSLNRCQVSLLG